MLATASSDATHFLVALIFPPFRLMKQEIAV